MLSTKKKKKGRVVAMILTHACNLNCVYCFEKHKSNKKMSFDTACSIVRQEMEDLRFHPETDYIKFDLFGGEHLFEFVLLR